MPRVPLILFVFALLGGCAAAQPPHLATPGVDAQQDDAGDVGSLVRKQADQQKHIAELEARIGLLEAEARHHRELASADRAPIAPTQTVHIGPAQKSADETVSDAHEPGDAELPREAPPAPRGKHERVPSLHLYGYASEPQAQLEPVPETSESLTVVPLPEERAKGLAPKGDAVDDTAATKAAYREALRLLRERRYDDALTALSVLLMQHPASREADKIYYWRGEAHYAKREYDLAKQEFEALLARFPQSEKTPDVLLKLGLCLRRLGDEARAQAYFRRVRAEYPGSEAATIASREGAT